MKIFGRKVEKWHIAMLMLIVYDAITICLSYFLALWFRFRRYRKSISPHIPPSYRFMRCFA